MVLDFKRFQEKRQKKANYRRQLVEQIVEHHRRAGHQEAHNVLYLEHLESGFPIHILEGIVERLTHAAS